MIQHTRGNAISLFIDDESKCAFAHGANCLCRMERQTGIAYEVKVRLPELWEADQRTKPGDRDKLGTASLVTWFGFDGEIQIIEDKETGKLVWECPNCGNRDEKKLNVARRTCGYIGSNFWNAGRTQEIKERVIHIGDN